MNSPRSRAVARAARPRPTLLASVGRAGMSGGAPPPLHRQAEDVHLRNAAEVRAALQDCNHCRRIYGGRVTWATRDGMRELQQL